MAEEAKSKYYFARVIYPCSCAVYMYKIMILFNNLFSVTTWPISTKFHAYSTVERELRVCSNGLALLTVMPVYGKK